MDKYVVRFREIDGSKLMVVGGKGANLGELCRIEELRVPDGFCVTTDAYKEMMGSNPELSGLLDELELLGMGDHARIEEVSGEIRRVIEGMEMPNSIAGDIAGMVEEMGEEYAYAVRSSATAEDLPTASFAGQHDTFLNVKGKDAIRQRIGQCWASLFTMRAVTYRLQLGYGHRNVQLGVVVQRMVFPQAAGIMFTADPVSGNRKVVSIDASFGLGEAMVSGMVNADSYKVRGGRITDKRISAKKLAIYARPDGGTVEQEVAPEQQNRQALSDEEIVELEGIGRKIEAHFGQPQDVEWCLEDGAFYIVQSRPITTLYPIPEVGDEGNHVYVSVGHQQMMTDAMKPLGLSFFRLTTLRPMFAAGGRLFVDVAANLASPAQRNMLLNVLGPSDPLIKDALTTIIERDDFIQLLPEGTQEQEPGKRNSVLLPHGQVENDPEIAAQLIRNNQASVATLQQNIQGKQGVDLFDFIVEDLGELRKDVFSPQSFGIIMAVAEAASWINTKMMEWLGEKGAANVLSQSVPNNVTSEMGLALLDVADVIRQCGEVVAYLQRVKGDNLIDGLGAVKGGPESKDAINGFLEKYGMRCVGEIDITRPRWREQPGTLVPLLLSNIKHFEPGYSARKFEQGLQEALAKEHELLERLRQLPDGAQKAADTQQKISLLRNFSGYREYPKYGMMSRYFVYRLALLQEATKLVQAGIMQQQEDIYYLTFEELREMVRTNEPQSELIEQRRAEYKVFEQLNPPRVMTSDGEIVNGSYKREDLPAGAIAGLAVSSGIVEGRARVIADIKDANIEDGDILVTTFTDPSWTPLFVAIKGLVTEVGGLMTHGAVIAREYGLPAVVGVEQATSLIKDGQRIKVNGTDGWVEVL